MAFKHRHEKKGFNLPSLIDIIFLLLIFFMVTVNISPVISERNRGIYTQKRMDLPEIRNRQTGPVLDRLQTLMFQIEYQNPQDPSTPMVIYALWPGDNDSVNTAAAMQLAIVRKQYAFLLPDQVRLADPDIPDVSPYEFITSEINRYARQHFKTAGLENHIEVRAVKQTEFKVINHILTTCAALEDRIPRIYVRIMSGGGETAVEEYVL